MSHLTVAASEKAFQELFAVLRDSFTFSDSNSANFGPFSASYDVALHLEGGTVDLRDDNTVRIEELDIKWDRLQVGLSFDIEEKCVGGFCIVPNPFDGCLVRAPRKCVFSENPDINIILDLSDLITSEITLTARPVVKYRAEVPVPNKWQVFIDPSEVDLDVIDIADTVGDLLEDAMTAVIDVVLGPLPDWAKDLIRAMLGPIIDLIRVILDIGDDIGEWLSDLLGVSLGLFNAIANFLADFLANKNPILEFEDPLPILEPTDELIPVKIPIRDLAVRVNTSEMILEANVEA